MPCALVTGATGFAGQHLARLLQRSGWDVVGTSRHAASGDDCPIEAVEISDVAGLARVLKAYRPKVVYHLAATVDTVETPDLVALYRTNVIGTAAVLEATRLTECVERVLLASSAFVYGPGNESGLPTPEDAPLRPVTPYGVSKVAAEAIGRQWVRDTGRDLVVTRAFQHTGPGHVGNFALADWARQLAAGGATLEVGNLGAVRDYLDVRDVVTAYESVMERGRAGEVYNVGSGRPVAMQDLLHGLVRAFGRDVTLVPRPERMRPSDEAKTRGRRPQDSPRNRLDAALDAARDAPRPGGVRQFPGVLRWCRSNSDRHYDGEPGQRFPVRHGTNDRATHGGDLSKRALITGITGQDGSYLAELLLSKGYEVHGLIRRARPSTPAGSTTSIRIRTSTGARLHLHYGDLTDGSRLVTLLNQIHPDEIYNLAAQSHVRVSFDDAGVHRRRHRARRRSGSSRRSGMAGSGLPVLPGVEL